MDWDEDAHPRGEGGRFGNGGVGISHALGLPTREVSHGEKQAFLKGVRERAAKEASAAASKPGLGASLKKWASKMAGEKKASQEGATAKLAPLKPGSGTVDKLMKGEAFEHKYPNGQKASISIRAGKVHIVSDKSNVETGPWQSGGSVRAAAHMAIHHVLSAAERE
jgi:protoporphyrinogen oxidase